jgi:hypothetical protein
LHIDTAYATILIVPRGTSTDKEVICHQVTKILMRTSL